MGKLLCRAQDVVSAEELNQEDAQKGKLPSFEFIWNTKRDEENLYLSQDFEVSLIDSCLFGNGAAMRHLYDWFLTTTDPFPDRYPLTTTKETETETVTVDAKIDENGQNTKSQK